MKKLCNAKGKRIHPSPPPSSPCDFLAALPAALLALAAALSPEEKEVLVYLLSPEEKKPQQLLHCQRKSHRPALGCGCFCCYKSFWAIWNASPNNHLIHRILDAVEENSESRKIRSCRRRRSRRGGRRKDFGEEMCLAAAAEVSSRGDVDGDEEEDEEEFDGMRDVDGEGGDGKSSVRRFVSFIGERVWGVWNC